jgi:hypothetical protein
MVEAIYARSRYDTSINYTRPLDPPLDAEQAAWVGQRLPEAVRERSTSMPQGKRRRK